MPDFGLSEFLVPLLGSSLAPIGAGALEGAGGGALLSGITGHDPLMGALTGGVTGGAIPALGPTLGEATGLGTTAGEALVGGGVGAGLSAVTGGNPLFGAISGTGAGLLAGAGSGGGTSGSDFGGGGDVAVSPTATTGASGVGAASAPAAFAGATPSATVTPGLNPASTISASPGGNIVSDVAASGGDFTGGTNLGGGSDFGGNGPAGNVSTASSSGGGILDKAIGFAKNNPLALAGIGLMGANMLMGNQPVPAEGQLRNLAGQTGDQALAMESYIQTGKLPTGLQAAIDQSTKANEAEIRSRFAGMGLSGSTMESQALSSIRENAAATAAKIATNLFQQGISLSQLSANEWSTLLSAQLQQDAAFNAALGRFAGGLAGARLSTGGASA